MEVSSTASPNPNPPLLILDAWMRCSDVPLASCYSLVYVPEFLSFLEIVNTSWEEKFQCWTLAQMEKLTCNCRHW